MRNLSNETLIKAIDVNNNAMLTTFYTNNPAEFLKMYKFCLINTIPLTIRIDKKVQIEELEGDIVDIIVDFGGGDFIPCIEVLVNIW